MNTAPALLRRLQLGDPIPSRAAPLDPATIHSASGILADIASRGESAAIDHAIRLGDISPGQPVVRDRADLARALDRLDPASRKVLERTASRIRTFAEAQRSCVRDLELPIPGGFAGHTWLPVASAGCYAPGGRFPLPSSVLMTAVTARAAGVRSVWVASPKPTEATLAAAAIAGADGLLAIGGAQAIGAFRRGLFNMPASDIIVGPGNRWVTAAKQLVSGEVGIDMLAGPSELLVLADETADPAVVAADLLAQAEHDDDAVAMLVTTSSSLPGAVDSELRKQIATLPTAGIATRSLANGFSIVCANMQEAVGLCDRIAPEHLEILCDRAETVAPRLQNAGAVFIGSLSAEALGDYGAGPNHVLPTSGTARFRAGLSVFSFLRARTWLRMTDQVGAGPLVHDSASLARMERLEGHARSAEMRLVARPGSDRAG
jgi:phosphoribosyl-ATP pyrophosphohydrolase/phosphoribosyl-AMP cyclohydrolase/histidinol dehydrogenase